MSTPSTAASVAAAKAVLLELNSKRTILEGKIGALKEQAKVSERLVDDEGFPRADVDVHGVRISRNELSTLQVDHQLLMKQIEAAMFAYHSELKNLPASERSTTTTSSTSSNGNGSGERKTPAPSATATTAATAAVPAKTITPSPITTVTEREVSPASLPPFYLVDQVFENSPANVAGLRTGDSILQFGSVTKANKTPTSLPELIANSVGKQIRITVYRNGDGIVYINLIPQRWDGKGMLGCHIKDIP